MDSFAATSMPKKQYSQPLPTEEESCHVAHLQLMCWVYFVSC